MPQPDHPVSTNLRSVCVAPSLLYLRGVHNVHVSVNRACGVNVSPVACCGVANLSSSRGFGIGIFTSRSTADSTVLPSPDQRWTYLNKGVRGAIALCWFSRRTSNTAHKWSHHREIALCYPVYRTGTSLLCFGGVKLSTKALLVSIAALMSALADILATERWRQGVTVFANQTEIFGRIVVGIAVNVMNV